MPNMLRKFGVELELDTMSNWSSTRDVWQRLRELRPPLSHTVVNVGAYQHSNGQYWDVKTDSSCGIEVASPALTLPRWEELQRVCETLATTYHVTTRCGLHVHHSTWDYSRRTRIKLLRWWTLLEDGFVGMTAQHRHNNPYCQKLGYSWVAVDLLAQTGRRALRLPTHRSIGFKRSTLEFRSLEGTLDPDKIYQWVVLTQSLVDVARRATRLQTMARLTNQPLDVRFKTFASIAAQPYKQQKQDPIHSVLDSAVAIVEKL